MSDQLYRKNLELQIFLQIFLFKKKENISKMKKKNLLFNTEIAQTVLNSYNKKYTFFYQTILLSLDDIEMN